MKNDAQYAARAPVLPRYLLETYWWAYVHPRAVQFFEREWLVNLILWGNFGRLRDAALDALGPRPGGRTLQVACVYGDLTPKLAARMADGARLDVLDVLPIQLANLQRKLSPNAPVALLHGDSAALPVESASYDQVLIFFLLHEQPADVRRATLAEALRVVRPGGHIVIVDYHRPHRFNPLYWPMAGVLRALEPYALDLWRHEISSWFPPGARLAGLRKETSFGNLYQVVTATV